MEYICVKEHEPFLAHQAQIHGYIGYTDMYRQYLPTSPLNQSTTPHVNCPVSIYQS